MNKVVLMGRLTREPNVTHTMNGDSELTVSRFTLAVDRRFKKEGENAADFISCVAFGKQGEFAERYLHQGTKVTLCGHIQTGSYTDRDGHKVYTTDIIVEEVEFAESKNSQNSETQARPEPDPASADGFMDIPDEVDEELPFN